MTMTETLAITLPQLECRELPVFAADNLDAVRAAFAPADSCELRQSWLSEPEADFMPTTVRAGWRGDALLVLAELEDADIFTRATALNQRMWELGDTFEIFLQPAGSPGYVEFHVTPNNQRLQVSFPDAAALQRAQASGSIEELLVAGEAFRSWTWPLPDKQCWFVYAEIPAAAVCGAQLPLTGTQWHFSFSRYDYARGRPEPILSSSSPHSLLNFHRRQEWGAIFFVRQKNYETEKFIGTSLRSRCHARRRRA